MYELSWTVAPDARGRGIGKKIVKALSDKINGTICAEIKNSNIQSISIAKSIGMELLKESDEILHFIKY